MRLLVLVFIRVYQICLSPLLGQHCRFYPSCSHYAHEAVQRFGVFHGLWFALKRLSRCHPWHAGGLDPVPEPKEKN